MLNVSIIQRFNMPMHMEKANFISASRALLNKIKTNERNTMKKMLMFKTSMPNLNG